MLTTATADSTTTVIAHAHRDSDARFATHPNSAVDSDLQSYKAAGVQYNGKYGSLTYNDFEDMYIDNNGGFASLM